VSVTVNGNFLLTQGASKKVRIHTSSVMKKSRVIFSALSMLKNVKMILFKVILFSGKRHITFVSPASDIFESFNLSLKVCVQKCKLLSNVEESFSFIFLLFFFLYQNSL